MGDENEQYAFLRIKYIKRLIVGEHFQHKRRFAFL